MKKYYHVILIIFFIAIHTLSCAQEGYPYRQVEFSNVKINDLFWSGKQHAHLEGTIPSAIVQVRDSTSRISNFEIAAGIKKGKYKGLVWDDSDVYKVMEGIANCLQNKRDPELEQLMDYWIGVISKAQLPDGYLNTFFILEKADDGLGKNLGRWQDMGRHEMYCAGHMIEAAIAYKKATGKTKFLQVARKFADHLLTTFGPGKRPWVPLHQQIELALVKLYYATNEKKYAEFAGWLLEQRGHGLEAGPMWDNGPETKKVDCQTDMPVKEMREAWGHAVRAMYMYSGMLDVSVSLKDSTYLAAVKSIWNDAVPDKTYITGGIGARRNGEAFGAKFELPNKEAYCETCASIGMVFWNNRMNLLYGDARYANVLERTLYNAVLSGVSLSGEKFFYTNPLESDGKTHRGSQYGIACCPSNMARFIPSVGNYIYMSKFDELVINLFVGNETRLKLRETPVQVTQKTNYPSPTLFYRNDSVSGNWLKVQLNGIDADKNGIGARVEITIGRQKIIREIDGGSSHSSQNSTIAHFGLGSAKLVDTVRVIWVGGKEQVMVNQKANQLLKIVESNNTGHGVKKIYWLLLLLPVMLVIVFFFIKRKNIKIEKTPTA